MAEMEEKGLCRQEEKMKSLKKAGKNQALSGTINSTLRKSETIPSCHFCDRHSQRPWSLLELHYVRPCADT